MLDQPGHVVPADHVDVRRRQQRSNTLPLAAQHRLHPQQPQVVPPPGLRRPGALGHLLWAITSTCKRPAIYFSRAISDNVTTVLPNPISQNRPSRYVLTMLLSKPLVSWARTARSFTSSQLYASSCHLLFARRRECSHGSICHF